jgi:hypothetical protein
MTNLREPRPPADVRMEVCCPETRDTKGEDVLEKIIAQYRDRNTRVPGSLMLKARLDQSEDPRGELRVPLARWSGPGPSQLKPVIILE